VHMPDAQFILGPSSTYFVTALSFVPPLDLYQPPKYKSAQKRQFYRGQGWLANM